MPSTEEGDRETRRQRYIQGICITCGAKPHSPGRPRCNDCHAIYQRWT